MKQSQQLTYHRDKSWVGVRPTVFTSKKKDAKKQRREMKMKLNAWK